MGLIKLIVFGFVFLTVIYVAVSVYSRSIRREKLENWWAEENPGSDDMAARDAYVEKGMAEYNAGIRPKLIALVYVVPTVVVIGTLIAVNWN